MGIRRKLVLTLIVGISLAATFVGVALAGHTHITNEYYHGVGDGDNNNNYVHPFTDNTAGHFHAPGVLYYYGGALQSSDSCSSCTHVHVTAYPNPERYADSWNWANSSQGGTHSLTGHLHNHE